jgi:hypothetical protein
VRVLVSVLVTAQEWVWVQAPSVALLMRLRALGGGGEVQAATSGLVTFDVGVGKDDTTNSIISNSNNTTAATAQSAPAPALASGAAPGVGVSSVREGNDISEGELVEYVRGGNRRERAKVLKIHREVSLHCKQRGCWKRLFVMLRVL